MLLFFFCNFDTVQFLFKKVKTFKKKLMVLELNRDFVLIYNTFYIFYLINCLSKFKNKTVTNN